MSDVEDGINEPADGIVPMRSRTNTHVLLEVMPKWGYFLCYTAFFAIIFVVFLLGQQHAPKPYANYTQKWEGTREIFAGNKSLSYSTITIFGELPYVYLNRWNQEFYLSIQFTAHKDIQKYMTFEKDNMEIDVQLKAHDGIKPIQITTQPNVHKRTLVCNEGAERCTMIVVMHQGFIQYNYYQPSFTLVNFLPLYDSGLLSEEIETSFVFVNPMYSIFETTYRYVLIASTVLILLLFFVALKVRIPNIADWHTEQKWILALLVLLLLFNNPFYPLSFYVNSWFFPFMNVVFFVTYIAFLLLFLLVMTHAILTPPRDRTKLGFYAPKVVLLGSLWLVTVITLAWQRLTERTDPGIASYEDVPFYKFIQYLAVGTIVVYMLSLLYYIMRALSAFNNLPQKYSYRFKALWVFTLVMIASTVVLYFVSISIGIHLAPLVFLFIHTLLSLYPFMLAIWYLPSSQVDYQSSHEIESMMDYY